MQVQSSDNPLKPKRVDYLDMLKCLGMFIVVSGHIHPYYKWFSLTVHCFVIPLYFLLSGMTFKRNKFSTLGEFIKHRAKTLLLPYLMLSLVTWVFWAVFNVVSHNQVDLWKPLLQTFIAQGSGGFLVHNVPLWFLPCLFIVEMLYYMIDKLPEWANIMCCVLLSVLGACMISWWRGPLSYCHGAWRAHLWQSYSIAQVIFWLSISDWLAFKKKFWEGRGCHWRLL